MKPAPVSILEGLSNPWASMPNLLKQPGRWERCSSLNPVDSKGQGPPIYLRENEHEEIAVL